MNLEPGKKTDGDNRSVAYQSSIKTKHSQTALSIRDNRPEAIAQRKLQEQADNSPKVKKAAELQELADNFTATQEKALQADNNTGLPDTLKSNIEDLSGYSMDDVKVHYNSDKPAQLQAHAYAYGTDIHIASGQEKHLAHEAWHVVQQKQGRVKPTLQLKNDTLINNEPSLETEAEKYSKSFTSGDITKSTMPTQRVLRNSPFQFKTIQRVVNHFHEVFQGHQRGRIMTATDLDNTNTHGGTATVQGTVIGGSDQVDQYGARGASPFCRQMHLLNSHLGGSGTAAENLGWGSNALNIQHANRVENHLNAAINHGGVINHYRVRVDYYQGGRPLNYNNLQQNDLRVIAAETARRAMIEKLYFEAEYTPDPNTAQITTRGLLTDNRGLDEMGNLAFNNHAQSIIPPDQNADANQFDNPLTHLNWQDGSNHNDVPGIDHNQANINDLPNRYTLPVPIVPLGQPVPLPIASAPAATVRAPRPPMTEVESIGRVAMRHTAEIQGHLNVNGAQAAKDYWRQRAMEVDPRITANRNTFDQLVYEFLFGTTLRANLNRSKNQIAIKWGF
ncbi:MAG: DUF4157 domain-containing protein [Roseivirga sp.]|nr:DUF4157 domain-containing protein [Roseivirga sp.]